MESMYEQFYQEPAYAPFPIAAARAGGMFGQKTGRAGIATRTARRSSRRGRPSPGAAEVRVGAPERAQPGSAGAVHRSYRKAGVRSRRGQAQRRGADHHHAGRLRRDHGGGRVEAGWRAHVAVDVLFGMKGPRTVMVSPATEPEIATRPTG